MSVGPADLAVCRATLIHSLFARRGRPALAGAQPTLTGSATGAIHSNT